MRIGRARDQRGGSRGCDRRHYGVYLRKRAPAVAPVILLLTRVRARNLHKHSVWLLDDVSDRLAGERLARRENGAGVPVAAAGCPRRKRWTSSLCQSPAIEQPGLVASGPSERRLGDHCWPADVEERRSAYVSHRQAPSLLGLYTIAVSSSAIQIISYQTGKNYDAIIGAIVNSFTLH